MSYRLATRVTRHLLLSVVTASGVSNAQTFEWTLALGTPEIVLAAAPSEHLEETYAVDLNADGREDLAFLRGVSPDLAPCIVLNTGTAGTFVAGPLQQVGSTDKYEQLHVTDVTGDSRPDLIVAGRGVPVRVFVNDGSQQPFKASAVQIAGTSARWTQGLAIGDVNGDNFPDVALANAGAGYSSGNDIYLSDGSGTPFAQSVRHPIGTDDVGGYQIVLADMNADGRRDAVISSVDIVGGFSGQQGGIRIYFNNGTADPFSGVAPVLLRTNNIGSGFAVADLNSDGRLDLATTVSGSLGSVWSVYLHTGSSDAPFDTGIQLEHTPYVSPDCHTILATDMNGDRRIDIAIGCTGGGLRPYRPVRVSGALYLNAGGLMPFASARPLELAVKAMPLGEPLSSVNMLGTLTIGDRPTLLVTSGVSPTGSVIESYPLIDDRRPIANDDAASTSRGRSLTIDVFANDFDVDGTIASDFAVVTQQGAHGYCAFDDVAKTFRYTPPPDFVGIDRCQYATKDNLGVYSNSATVTVTITDGAAAQNDGGGTSGGGSLGTAILLFMYGLRIARRSSRWPSPGWNRQRG